MKLKIRWRNTKEMSPIVGFFTDDKWYRIYELENGSNVCECWKPSCLYPWKIALWTGWYDNNWREVYKDVTNELRWME